MSMIKTVRWLTLWLFAMPLAEAVPPPAGPAAVIPDPRHIANGWPIPSEGYADQPYIVKTDDGA